MIVYALGIAMGYRRVMGFPAKIWRKSPEKVRLTAEYGL
jgi:hypothetical protein